MLRRSFLATAAALPTASWACLEHDIAGSSVSPLGRIVAPAACALPTLPPGRRSFESLRTSTQTFWNMAVGRIPPLVGLYPVAGGINEALATIRNSQERDEIAELANRAGIGAGSGASIGYFTRWGAGFGGAVGWGLGVTWYLWGGSQVLIRNLALQGGYMINMSHPFFADSQASYLGAVGSFAGAYGLGFRGYGPPADVGQGMNGGWLSGNSSAMPSSGKDME